MDQKGHVNSLLEDGWFFGNTLANKPRSSKMVRCNSDPCPCSTTKETTNSVSMSKEKLHRSNLLRTPSLPPCLGGERKYSQNENEDEDTNSISMSKKKPHRSNLLRTPSLPPCLGGERKYSQNENEDEDEDETRMGDLIRQAMPLPMPRQRRLERVPSLPPCRGSNGNGMPKLSRRASIDSSSMFLPPKYNSKSGGNSKSRAQKKQDLPNINGPTKDNTRSQSLSKSLSDLEIEELQGFKDLGFSFDKKEVSTKTAQILPVLQTRDSIGNNLNDNCKLIRRPYLSEAWQCQSSSPFSAPPMVKQPDQKAASAEEMKTQIKFWARAVASNVRQEC